MSVSRVLDMRYVALAILRKTTVSTATKGSSTKEITASFQSSISITAARPMIFTILRNSLTRMPEYISSSASTSLVTLVTSFPTGVRSK